MKRFIAILLTLLLLISLTLSVRATDENDYKVAQYVWNYLQREGYNDYVCAGILGNMMVEVGGKTLNLKPNLIYNKRYYGICQWCKKYYPKVWNTSLKYQCKFLCTSIEDEFNVFGSLYRKNFNYDKFIKMRDYKQAALAFAKVYERCDSGSYTDRQKCAKLAFEHFAR